MSRVVWAAWAFAGLAALSVSDAGAQAKSPLGSPAPDEEVTVIADQMEQMGAEGLVIATGNVEVTRGTARLTADRVEYNRTTGDAVARGRVVFYDGEDRLRAERIDYNFRTGTGVIYEGEARTSPYYRLSGERLERIGESAYRVRRGVFTTCEADPPAWSFHVGSATADLNEFLSGTNASFWVRNLPLIPWMPYFAAAIRRERQTGFLFPRLGMSSRKGIAAEVPFYWAISDSQDATIAPIAYEKAGIGLNADYRYVLSDQQQGHWKAFYLHETQLQDKDRGWFAVSHDWRITSRLTLKVDTRNVTDDRVFRDYGDQLDQRSQLRVQSNVFLTQRWDSWSLVGNAFWYQDLTNSHPVELDRLPEIRLAGPRQPVPGVPGALWELSGSAVHFVRDVGSDGSRLDVAPRLSRPISADGLFTVTPFVGGRLTEYDKRVTGAHRERDGTLVENTESTFVARQLVEAGTDLETSVSRVYHPGRWGFDALLHSIEPRLNYTWVDGENTHRLPSWSDLDRVGASNGIEYSLTNRVRGRTVAPSETEALKFEVLRFVVGHSYDIRASRTGDVVGDLIVQPTPSLRFRGNMREDTHGQGITLANTDVSAQIERVSASVGTRYAQAAHTNFVQGGLTADISRNLLGRFGTNWDLRTHTFVENRYGVDLRFQCYSLSLDYIDRSKAAGRGGEDEVRFTLNLLGVGGPISTSIGIGSLTSSGGKSSQ